MIVFPLDQGKQGERGKGGDKEMYQKQHCLYDEILMSFNATRIIFVDGTELFWDYNLKL